MHKAEIRLKKLDKNVLDLMWKLTSNNSTSRIDACANILQILQSKQNEVENSDEKCKDLEYSVERLIKGLASPRESARLGFALLLTEVLKKLTIVDIADILELMKSHLSAISKQERRDAIFGQLFAYSAIVRSGRLPEDSHLSDVVSSLYELWQGKIYILNASYEILVDLFSQLSEEKFKETIWPNLKQKLTCGWEQCSPDVLWLLLLCMRIFPGSTSEKFLKKHWGNRDMLSISNIDYLKKIIRKTTSCLPRLHPLCKEFAAICIGRKDMKDVWNAVIDDNLFDADQTVAYVGFEIVKHVLQGNPKKKVLKHVFSARFCSTFTKSFLSPKHPMYPAAVQLANFLCDYVKKNKDPDIQFIILKVFLQPPGSVLSDQIFKKIEVSTIIQSLLPDAVKLYCELLKSIVLKKKSESSNDKEENGVHSKGFQAVVQIGSLVNHPITIKDVAWRIDVTKFLFLHAFFIIKKPVDILHCETVFDEIPSNLRECFKNAFYKALHSLHPKSEQNSASTDEFLQLLSNLEKYVEQLMAAVEFVEPQYSREKVEESWSKMLTRLWSIVHKFGKQKKKDGQTNESSAFQTLFLELGFHLFDDPDNISEILEEVHICCKKALHVRKHADGVLDDDEPSWIVVLVDILLSLLSRSSQHMRNMVTSIFPLLCPFITADALQQILAVINPIKEGDDPMLVETAGESDVDFDSGTSSDESESNEQENSKVDDEFRQKVKKALGHAAEISDAESIVLSDSEMFKLDDAISEAFQSRVATGHTQMNAEDKTMLHFRVRCLDLIMAFLKSNPPMNFVLQCVEPLLAAYEFGNKNKHQTQLLRKIVSTLQILTKIKKFKDVEAVQKSELKTLLENLISKCHKETNLVVANILYSLCVFLVLCFRRIESQKSPEKKSKKFPFYLTSYLSALDTFAKSSSSFIYPQFFATLMESCPDLAWSFINPCKEYAFNYDIRMYKKTQCFGLIFEALKFSKKQNSVTKDDWMDLGNSLIPAAVEILKKALNSSEIKPVYLIELLDVIYMCHSIVQEKTNQSTLEKHPELLPLLTDITKGQVKKLTKKGNSIRRKIILSLGGTLEQIKTDKANPTEVPNIEEPIASVAPEEDSENEIPEKVTTSSESKKRKSKPKEKKKKKLKLDSSKSEM